MKAVWILFLFSSLAWCQQPALTSLYETCDEKNSYLEPFWAKLIKEHETNVECNSTAQSNLKKDFSDVENISNKVGFSPECIAVSQSTMGTLWGANFNFCIERQGAAAPVDRPSINESGDKKGSIQTKLPRPCLSKAYAEQTYQQFRNALRCVGGISEAEFFSIIHIESRFHVNVGNNGAGYGVGQIENTKLPVELVFAKFSDREECRSVKKILDAPASLSKPCDWIMPPENPLRNFLWAAIKFNRFRELSLSLLKKASFFKKLSKQDSSHTIYDLTLMMYNGGPVAIENCLKLLVAQDGIDIRSFADFKREMNKVIREHFGEGSKYYEGLSAEALKKKREIVVSYPDHVRSSAKSVEAVAKKKYDLTIHCGS